MDVVLSSDMNMLIQDHMVNRDGLEWTIAYDDINNEIVDNLFLYLRMLDFDEKVYDEQLKVVGENVTLTITGLANIAKYCYSESPDAQVTDKRFETVKVEQDVALPNDFPVSLRSVKRSVAPVEEPDADTWMATGKMYSIEKVYEYTSKDGAMYRVKVIKSAPEISQSMEMSGVSGMKPGFSFEYVVDKKVGEKQVQSIIRNIVVGIQMITGQQFPLAIAQQKEVLSKYDALVKSVVKMRYATDDIHFLAPKPITVETINVIDPGPQTYGVTSVWQDYAVTDKADGERFLMYIDEEGHAFFINNTFQVSYAGIQIKRKDYTNTLLDGEFVHGYKRRDDKTADIFAAFDIYFVNGKSVMDRPLMPYTGTGGVAGDRYSVLRELCDGSMWSPQTYVELRCKEHIAADGAAMKKACHDMLQNHMKLPYDIDGLVFTPRYLSVFGYYPGKPVEITDNVRWDKVYKWKPPEQNTIDFMVELGQIALHPITKKRYQTLRLYTGYNSLQWEPIAPLDGLRLRYDATYAKQQRVMGDTYRAKLFQPVSYFEPGVEMAHIDVSAAGEVVADDGTVIENRSIVEFSYTPDKSLPVNKRWKPLRVRMDKTRMLQKTGKLTKTANDLSVAISIWRSIHDPVTTEMICGISAPKLSSIPDTLEERLLGTDDVYYKRDIPRMHMLSVHMLNFHNQGIKKQLYQRSKKRDALMELACGMAGDMPRWRDGGYKFVLGVDLVRDNITKPRDGAYARMLSQRRAVKTMNAGIEETIYPDVVFVVGDCARPIHTGNAADGLDDDSVKILRTMYHGSGNIPQHMKYIVGRAAKGFSVVSCQFAIHYFFKTEATLHGFLENVSYNLRKGGIFVATFMDGQKVDAMLSESPNGIVEGRKLDDRFPVWAIIKRYDSIDKELTNNFGKHVDVFLENTNKLIPEFLVHFDLLVEKAKMYGLELKDTAMFSENFAKLHAAVPKDPKRRTQLDADILALADDPVQTRFSFLNRWVVFEKTG